MLTWWTFILFFSAKDWNYCVLWKKLCVRCLSSKHQPGWICDIFIQEQLFTTWKFKTTWTDKSFANFWLLYTNSTYLYTFQQIWYIPKTDKSFSNLLHLHKFNIHIFTYFYKCKLGQRISMHSTENTWVCELSTHM